MTSQALYFHLGMSADDDGFLANPRTIQRMIGAKPDDLAVLCAKGFVIPFDSGVVAIRHWRVSNYIRPDRYRETIYRDEASLVLLSESNIYEALGSSSDVGAACGRYPDGIQMVSNLDTEVRLGKYSLGEGKEESSAFVVEVVGYLNERTGANFKPTTKKTVRLVNARRNEGNTVEDFKAVIDVMASQWLHDSKMSRYLRPETLFGAKFEGYLNESRKDKGGSAHDFSEYDF